MLKGLSFLCGYAARRLRSSVLTRNDQSIINQKLTFSDDQLASMSLKGPQRRKSILKTFKQKYKDIEQEREQGGKDERPSASMQMQARKDVRQKFRSFRIYNKKRRLRASALEQLSRVRLGEQYLPLEYMKRVQKIFMKYDQATLRDISQHFTNLVRMRYSEAKINFDEYPDLGFNRLELQLPKAAEVEQIYLIGKSSLAKPIEEEKTKKVDEEPIDPTMNYTQNVAISYLLRRVPRTYATAYRVLTQLRKKFPEREIKSFIDFGAGLDCGALAFTEVFKESGEVYSVQPAGKMRKLAKYLTGNLIQHYESLGQLSSRVRHVDVLYVGYVLNQLRPELVQVYLESFLAKLHLGGFLCVVEYGNPYGTRLVHECREWALGKKMQIVAPCPHHMKCPLARGKEWCHFDQPAGMYPREIFGKLPTDNSVKLQKYSYLILQKMVQEVEEGVKTHVNEARDPSADWERVLFPLMKRGKHFVFTLCSKNGAFQKRIAARSHGVEYVEGRRLKWGDYWRFGKRIPNRYRKERKTGLRLW